MTFDVRKIPSAEGNVSKFVLTNADAIAETVLYRYPDYETRTVICCSTQSGCPVGCRFCGAGDFFVRSFQGEEIVEQVEIALTDTGVDPNSIARLQIMFMSMGEPLLNQTGLERAIRLLHDKYPRAALLISTSAPRVGYEGIRALSQEVPTVGLQFSVHETTDERRDALIPFKAKLTLAEIKREGEAWHAATGRNPFFNYCAGPDNSTDEDADRLLALFDPSIWCATVSVVCERNDGLPARSEFQRNLAADFSEKMVARGYNTRVFDPAGQDDIGGGCGQLWFVQNWMKEHPERARPSCGNGRPVVHAPALPAAPTPKE